MFRLAVSCCAAAVALAAKPGLAQAPAAPPVPVQTAAPAASDYPTVAVPATRVAIADGFWAPRIETVRTVTIGATFKQSELTGRIKNFEIAGGSASGEFCSRYAFDDSDVFKIIEGASYALALKPDSALDGYLDTLIAKIARAQEPDGYLYTARTISPAKPMAMAGRERWTNEEESHELYNLGHLYEAAVAHFQATGKRSLLDVAVKSANLVARTFGPAGLRYPPGHQEIEIGLVKLYRVTQDSRYLALAKFFLDERGNPAGHKLYGEYSQDHKPVVDQDTAVGHSVRAAYMYSAMADVAALTGDLRYVAALDRLWEDVVYRKLYLTGGIGATGAWEGFGPAYDLPNSAYAETCASIANALWNHRMFLLKQDARYMDVYERAVYNAMLSGISLAGDTFFYPNPLLSLGQHERSPWFACACCPSNLPRFILSVPGHAYATAGDRVFVNLFVQGRARIPTAGGELVLDQQTRYPWDGDIRITVSPAKAGRFPLYVRVPGWAMDHPVPGDLYRDLAPVRDSVTLKVNGLLVPIRLERGYAVVIRDWTSGDAIDLHLPMPVRRVVAHPAVKADEGRVAVERGPLVYAAEFVDNAGRVTNLVLDDRAPLEAAWRPDLLNGITTVTGRATAIRMQHEAPVSQAVPLTLIPYYGWAHRGKGEMAVWLARRTDRARPAPEPTLASTSKASSSEGGKGLQGLNEQYEPTDSNDHTAMYFHWWPKKDSTEWVQYDFPSETSVSETSVYWFDDTGQGGCRTPRRWRVLYLRGSDWVPVATADAYGVAKDTYNTVRFTPVRTTAIRLEVELPEAFSAGIQEWKIK
jgi:hypothetical protein